MTKKQLTQKYLDFCNSFGVAPTNHYKEIIDKYYIDEQVIYSDQTDELRRDIIRDYLKVCKDFNVVPSKHFKDFPTSKIDCYRVKIINTVVEKEFGNSFRELYKDGLEGINRASRIKTCILALYDQSIYLNREEAQPFFNSGNNAEELESIYREFGGETYVDLKGCDEDCDSVENEEYEDEEIN